MQLLVGLRFIHENGYAHRDIKPENIIVTEGLELKYIDLGLACADSVWVKVWGCDNWKHGTLLYMPPEFYKGTATNSFLGAKAHDVWSLTVVLFELANGSFVLPFDYIGLPRNTIEYNISIAPTRRSNYLLDQGEVNKFIDGALVNNWETRPPVEELISFLIRTVPMTSTTLALV